MPRRVRPSLSVIHDSTSATGVGPAIDVQDSRHVSFQVSTDNTATLTYKFQGSFADTAPDFSAAQSTSNAWDYIEVVDLQDGSLIDGDTGVALAGVTDVAGSRMLALNTDLMKWVSVEVTAWTAGGLTVGVFTAND